ncbi:hypothetical protein ACIRQY_05410 [Streptomyces sp. NPDC101490]|uniref:hypothetical protein n=1 Tax=Streptomyces sp. NPDC101490 TaxID=3366143 RepID=UPI00381D2CA5
MRDLIARTLVRMLCVFAPRRPGRHSATFLAHRPGPEPVPVSPWSRPWSSPSREEVAERFRWEAENTPGLLIIRERRRALDAASRGLDYPYTYPGAPFRAEHFAAAGVTA